MKKSLMFKMAQEAVLRDEGTPNSYKLEILRLLMTEEDIAKLVEGKDEEK